MSNHIEYKKALYVIDFLV